MVAASRRDDAPRLQCIHAFPPCAESFFLAFAGGERVAEFVL